LHVGLTALDLGHDHQRVPELIDFLLEVHLPSV
jgi:hypothetical protein